MTDLTPDGAGHLHHEQLVLLEVAVQLCQNVSCLHVGLRQVLTVDCRSLQAAMPNNQSVHT